MRLRERLFGWLADMIAERVKSEIWVRVSHGEGADITRVTICQAEQLANYYGTAFVCELRLKDGPTG